MRLPESTFAVLIGIEQHAAGPQLDLDGPALDACRFAELLVRAGASADRVELVLSPLQKNRHVLDKMTARGHRVRPASREHVSDALVHELRRVHSELLIVYGAGHGVVRDSDDARAMFYANTTNDNRDNLDVTHAMLALRSRDYVALPNQVFIWDVCAQYLSEWEDERGIAHERFAVNDERADGTTQIILFSARKGKLARNDDAEPGGTFTRAVLNAVRECDESSISVAWERVVASLRGTFSPPADEPHYLQLDDGVGATEHQFGDWAYIARGPRLTQSVWLGQPAYDALDRIVVGSPSPANVQQILARAVTEFAINLSGRLTIRRVLMELRHQVRPDGLFRFVATIAEGSAGPVREDYIEWIDRTAPTCGLAPASISALRVSRPQILAYLDGSPIRSEQYTARFWVASGGESVQVRAPTTSVDIDTVVTILDEILATFGMSRRSVDAPIVHLMLNVKDPFEAFRWVLRREKMWRLAEDVPLVFRLPSSPRRPIQRERNRWARISDVSNPDDSVAWLTVLDDATPDNLELSNALCAICDFGIGVADGRGAGALAAVLTSGVPIVLWLDGPVGSHDPGSLLAGFVDGQELSGLPDRLRSIRASSGGASGSQRRGRVALAWNDPDVRAEMLIMRFPAMRRASQ